MEIKLNVSIGATLQVRNAKGEWDWIKPEVGAEVLLINEEVQREYIQEQFGNLWDNIVGPQFKNVVDNLLSDQVESESESESSTEDEETSKDKPISDEEDYD
jgi:hypothetical protein